jgi:putative ATP-dependent endonuclease of OLD family
MKLRHVKIKNFRCLVDVDIPIDDTTILIGENNSGKTAFLEALRIVFSRGLFGGKWIFDEFDYHMANQNDTPETSPGIEIELTFREDHVAEWSVDILQVLNEIVQTDAEQNLNLIILRVRSAYDVSSKSIVNSAEFLDITHQPLAGSGAKSLNKRNFAEYIRMFYLASLRNPENEFSARSQFWGQILKDLRVDQAQQNKLIKKLEKLNKDILNADPRLDQVVKTLDNAQNVMGLGSGQNTSVQALPMTPWELLSRAEVVIQNGTGKVKLPIQNHGQGIQSLTVLFLFEAYIQIFLKPNFTPDTEAILELEEPEAHLHPQAIRTLSKHLHQIQGQKLISTHSPYFVQEIPLSQLRLFKRNARGTTVYHIKRSYSIDMSSSLGLEQFCVTHAPKYKNSPMRQKLTVYGKMTEDERRDLLVLFNNQQGPQTSINELFKQSRFYICDEELLKLQNYVSRSRGDIMFSKAWLLCEGQCEYILLRYFSELAGKPFDQSGVAVIDFKNNGDLEPFILLAKAFDVPWILTCDNDDEGRKYIKVAKDLCDKKPKKTFKPLPKGFVDLEQFLYASFSSQYLSILGKEARDQSPRAAEWTLAKTNTMRLKLLVSGEYNIEQGALQFSQSSPEFQEKAMEIVPNHLRKNKVYYAQLLVSYLSLNNASGGDVPVFYRDLIDDAAKMAGVA